MNNDCNLILIRGVSGAGKSTIGDLIAADDNSTKVIATDDMMTIGGIYRFDAGKLPEYHAATVQKVELWMAEYDWKIGDTDYSWPDIINRIIVCNTFTQDWEMKPYFELAKEYDWRIHTIIVENRHGSDSLHMVPADIILQQKDRFEVIL